MLDEPREQEAVFWHTLQDGRIECGLCPHKCKMSEGETSKICKIRHVKNGKLYLQYYGMVATQGKADPIEKKPLYLFHPGTHVLSFGGISCNFHCDNCQNESLSQDYDVHSMFSLSAEEIVEMMRRERCQGVAWTYNEPTLYWETYYDWSKYIREQGFFVVWVSNSYIQADPLIKLAEVVDAFNFDVKSFREDFYQRYIRGHLKPVLDTCILAKKLGKHIELTYLVIPTLNDAPQEIKEYLQWVKENLGLYTPLHFSRFYPQNRLQHLPATPITTVYEVVETAKSMGFPYVYAGNIHPNPYQNTLCPKCNQVLIERQGYRIKTVSIPNHQCPYCSYSLGF